ncbi:MAG: glycosyltransferase family 4 protein [Ginsengibacter sp.]
MKILHLIYTTGVAGAEKHLLYLLPALKKFDVHCELLLICPKRNIDDLRQYCEGLNERGIMTTLFPVKSRMFYLTASKKIFRYLKSCGIGIVHSHLFSADFIAVLIKKLYFRDVIIFSTKHGYEEKYLVQYGLGNKKVRYNLYYFLSKVIIKITDHNVAVSQALSEMYYFLKLSATRMKYIHHGICLNASSAQAEVKGEPIIIIVGRLYTIKGHNYLFQALPEIIEKFPELKLLVLGEGPLRDELIKQATALNVNHHIEFVGFAPPAKYIHRCQLMVVPSLFESFGLVYIESFALKIPVVAFDVEAGNQIIENNKTGILVPRGNIDMLSKAIIRLLQSPNQRKIIVENAYTKYLSNYTVERMAKETAEWYFSILNDKQFSRSF